MCALRAMTGFRGGEIRRRIWRGPGCVSCMNLRFLFLGGVLLYIKCKSIIQVVGLGESLTSHILSTFLAPIFAEGLLHMRTYQKKKPPLLKEIINKKNCVLYMSVSS